MNNVNFTTSGWMNDIFESIKDKPLACIALPGSHDAGMSISTSCTIGANKNNTKTQNLVIKKQLEAGVRYFDLRPIFRFATSTHGPYTCGHFSKIPVLGYQGCMGEELGDIVKGLREFLDKNRKELVILDFSHYLSEVLKDVIDFKDDINKLIEYIGLNLKNYLLRLPDSQKPIADYTFGELINHGNVLVRYSGIDSSHYEQGVFDHKAFEIYDEYSGTNDPNEMKRDQWHKYEELYSGMAPNYHIMYSQKYKTTLTGSYANLTVIKQIAKMDNMFSLRVNLTQEKEYYIAGQSTDKKFFLRKMKENGELDSNNTYEKTWSNYYDFLSSYPGYSNSHLIGYSKLTRRLFIQPLMASGQLGDETYTATYDIVFDNMCVFRLGNDSFLACQNKTSLILWVYKLTISGSAPELIGSTNLECFYNTLHVMKTNDCSYLLGQCESNRQFFMHTINSNGTVNKTHCYKSEWNNYYQTMTSFKLNERYFIACQTEYKNMYVIDEVKIKDKETISLDTVYCRNWANMYPVNAAFNIENKTFRILHRINDNRFYIEKLEIYDLFLLSWTLTQGDVESVLSNKKVAGVITSSTFDSIETLANKANRMLNSELEAKIADGTITNKNVPNIVYLDFCSPELSAPIIKLNLL